MRLHRVDEQLVAAVEDEYDRLEQPTRRVESQTQPPRWAVVIKVRNEDRMLRRLDPVVGADSALQSRRVDTY